MMDCLARRRLALPRKTQRSPARSSIVCIARHAVEISWERRHSTAFASRRRRRAIGWTACLSSHRRKVVESPFRVVSLLLHPLFHPSLLYLLSHSERSAGGVFDCFSLTQVRDKLQLPQTINATLCVTENVL